MAESEFRYRTGWLRDFPDFRDLTPASPEIKPALAKAVSRSAGKEKAGEDGKVDLRQWCSPIEDQGDLGSCTAHAGVGMVEFHERKRNGKHMDASRLFLYKVTRQMAGLQGDSGAFLRTTMGALVLFGTPPEMYWPYNVADFDKDPPAFCFAYAQNYQALKYYRLDPPGTPTDRILEQVKQHLASELPLMFGFTVFSSISEAQKTGKIPFPTRGDRFSGGHAVMAVGYDDKLVIKPANPQGQTTTGALLIRNSWGSGWGDGGYGWLPYQYVLDGLASDWWALIEREYVETYEFAA
ncbi:MAG: C1 family peptidase [candidate division WOR-3 bacterium]